VLARKHPPQCCAVCKGVGEYWLFLSYSRKFGSAALGIRATVLMYCGYTIDISQYRLLFGFFPLQYIRTVFCFNCLTAQLSGELRWRGPNSISKFDHHNINGGGVEDT
jgi:hypothetical protein